MRRIASLPENQIVYFAACEIVYRALVRLGVPLQPVGNHFSILSGYAFESSSYTSGGVRLLRNINVKPDHIDWSQTVCLSTEEATHHERFRLAAHDLVLSMDGTVNNQGIKIAFLGQADVPALLLQRVCRFDPTGTVKKCFLFHVLHSEDFLDHLDESNRSIAIPHVSAGQLKSFKIPIPDSQTQASICEFLNAVKAGTPPSQWPELPTVFARERRIVARIEELAAQIENVGVLRKEVSAESDALIISTHLRLSGSRKRKLGEFLTLDEQEVKIIPTEEYPQVGVRGFGGGLFSKNSVLGSQTTYRTFNQLYEGALVLSQVKGWEGAVGVCGPALAGSYVSPEYRTFRCVPEEARPRYLEAVVRTEWFWGRLKDATRGVGARRERTRPEQFLEIQIPMPDYSGQEAGERIFAGVGRLRTLQTEISPELDALMPSILDKAFRGEL